MHIQEKDWNRNFYHQCFRLLCIISNVIKEKQAIFGRFSKETSRCCIVYMLRENEMEKFKSLFKETHQFIDEGNVTAWKSNLPKEFDVSGQCSSLDG